MRERERIEKEEEKGILFNFSSRQPIVCLFNNSDISFKHNLLDIIKYSLYAILILKGILG